MSEGIQRFDRWLEDQLVFGLAALEADPRASLEPVAARLTDDQLPNAASALRGHVPRIGREADWVERLGEDIGYWHLLNQMALQPERLDANTFAGLAFAYGYRLQKAKLPDLGQTVTDHWTCVGLREGNDDALYYRRTYWRGTQPHHALTQSTYNYGGPLPPTQLTVGSHGALAMLAYPGGLPTRGVLPEGATLREGGRGVVHPPHHYPTWGDQSAAHTALIQRQPWRRSFPVAVGPLRAEVSYDERGAYRLLLRDANGEHSALPLRGAVPEGDPSVARHAKLLATVGAGAFVLYGESHRGTLQPHGLLLHDRVLPV